MKKTIVCTLILMILAVYAGSPDIVRAGKAGAAKYHTDSKDTTWSSYAVGGSGYLWNPIKRERATFYDVSDFTLSYPVVIHGVSVYCTAADTNYTFSYKIYDKDGVTLLWQSDPVTSIAYDNDLMLDIPISINDDFWVSIVPDASGFPRVFSGLELGSDPSSTHSYLKANDGSWNPFTDGTDYYEMFASVLLSPYDGTDTSAPTVREIAGNEVFMDRPMELTLTLHEQNQIISPMQAQYNVGAGWVDFNMTQLVKGSYTFTGTIPAHMGGTSGLVKFFLADDQSNTAWSSEYPIYWSKDIPLFSENFESGVFPPSGWTVDNTGAGFVSVDVLSSYIGIYEGSYSAAHLDDMGAQDDWLITPSIYLPAENSCTVSFWQNAYFVEFITFNEISVSTDKVNWTQVYVPPFDPANWELTENIWQEIRFSLGDWSGQNVYIGFHYVGDYSNQWYIDDLKIYYDYKIPEIKNIYANPALLPDIGAFVDNDMIISLDVYDYTGIKSITGHCQLGADPAFDVTFTKSKADETWSGTISANAAAVSGTIYFTLEDVGGIVGDSPSYPISFVEDTSIAVIKNFNSNDPVFINNIMNIEVSFEDESQISSVAGYFSKDNWSTQSDITMTPSKIHKYSYTGQIPAETVETFGEVKFVITDTHGNVLNSDAYPVKWLEGYEAFFEDFEGSNTDPTWDYSVGSWQNVTNIFHSSTTSLHDSPLGNYPNNMNSSINTRIFDFSAAYAATLYFWAKVDLETGWDYVYLEATKDDINWTKIYTFNGEGKDWEFYEINLGSMALEPSVRFRFRIVTDTNTVFDGMHIDDVSLAVYLKDYAPPVITYAGPEQITATEYTIPREFTIPVGMGDYKFNVELTDISGISEVKVVYSVDGGAEQEAIPPVSSGVSGTYELTIPAQTAGSKITYRIAAKDNSDYKNSAETTGYMIRFGNFLYYQNGDDFTDYLDMIGNSTSCTAQAVAKRVTMGPMDGDVNDIYKADLVGITIDNYIRTEDGYPSDPMYVHVWADDGGKPGADIIPPIYTVQAATDLSSYEITYVDLRPYAADLSGIEGDVFVGYTSAGSVTNILYEVVASHLSVPGYAAFQRSWLGTGDESDLSWALDPASVYHISAVTGEYEWVGINGSENEPLTTKLFQNYPNPFNPETTIKFSLSENSTVELSVYNAKGERVVSLLNGEMNKGNYSRKFDGSSLVSGIYYSVLKVNNKTITSKMIMLK